MTRQEYLNSESPNRHREYYSQFVTEHTKNLVLRTFTRTTILDSKDPHFNDLPLQMWDRIAGISRDTASKLRELGDSPTLGGGVCILKEAAQQIREGK